jgi:hypothetical protein
VRARLPVWIQRRGLRIRCVHRRSSSGNQSISCSSAKRKLLLL